MDDGMRKKLSAKCCYGHLGGTLGGRLFERLVELGWFARMEDSTTAYSITPRGEEELVRLGVDIYKRR